MYKNKAAVSGVLQTGIQPSDDELESMTTVNSPTNGDEVGIWSDFALEGLNDYE